MSGSTLYRTIRDDILAIWNAAWTHSNVPVFWRGNDADPLPDPSEAVNFLRNEVDFGRETIRAFGAGLTRNERAQFGSVILRVFTARSVQAEDVALGLMGDAMAAFRSVRTANLSFVGEGSGFDAGPTEDGNWFMRGSLIVWEYRFQG